MLKGIPAVISPDLMAIMMSMGHGDELVLADGNFPAEANAQRLVRADGHGVLPLLEAVLRFFPIDTFVDDVAVVMQPVEASPAEPAIWSSYRKLLAGSEGRAIGLHPLGREAFYHRARLAYAIVATGESALYANLIIKKGVVPPNGATP